MNCRISISCLISLIVSIKNWMTNKAFKMEKLFWDILLTLISIWWALKPKILHVLSFTVFWRHAVSMFTPSFGKCGCWSFPSNEWFIVLLIYGAIISNTELEVIWTKLKTNLRFWFIFKLHFPSDTWWLVNGILCW